MRANIYKVLVAKNSRSTPMQKGNQVFKHFDLERASGISLR